MVFPDVGSFMSDQDIDAGTLPMHRVKTELSGSSCGILVVTRQNQERQWLNFEAGAMFKELGSEVSRVIPLLVDLEAADLRGPMGLLQAIPLDEAGLIHKLLPSLCHAFGVDKEPRIKVGQVFVPSLLDGVQAAKRLHAIPDDERPDVPGMLAEILSIVRALSKKSTSSDARWDTWEERRALSHLIPNVTWHTGPDEVPSFEDLRRRLEKDLRAQVKDREPEVDRGDPQPES